MKDFKNNKQHVITQRNNSETFPRPLRNKGNSRNAARQPVSRAQDLSPRPLREREKTLDERSEFSVLGVGYNPSSRKAAFTSGYRRAAFTLAEGGRRPLLNSGYRRAAFTLAEVLITLAVIGIVAVLTIPALVKNHQEKAWMW